MTPFALITLFTVTMLTVGCVSTPASSPVSTDEFGHTYQWLSNEKIAVKVFLPDAATGHYRGPRFDWSGMIGRVRVGDDYFLGSFMPQSPMPESHEYNATGPADEFGMTSPLGYAEARPGETFIKIGVGHLVKPADESGYQFYRRYTIAKAGEWSVESTADSIRFHQTLQDARGWGYTYEKCIELTAGESGFVIHHKLSNTGTKPIATDVYCHNFIRFNDEPVGGGDAIDFNAPLTAQKLEGRTDLAAFDATGLRIVGPLGKSEFIKGECVAAAPATLPKRFTVTNGRQSVEITADQAPEFLRFFVAPSAICPEPFLPINLVSGQSARWSTKYRVVIHS